jgi:hypothetical protein
MRFNPLVLVVFLSVASLASAPGQEPRFSRIAEGFTPTGEIGKIEVSYRAFTAPQLLELYTAGIRVATIEVTPPIIKLKVGQKCSLADIAVIALNAEGQRLDHIPFSVDLADTDPPIIGLDDMKVNGNQIEGLAQGTRKLRFSAALPSDDGPIATMTIDVVVSN